MPSSWSTAMHGKSLLNGAKRLLGCLAIITLTPPLLLTADTALIACAGPGTVVKQRTTFPATGVLLSDRDSQTLQVNTFFFQRALWFHFPYHKPNYSCKKFQFS